MWLHAVSVRLTNIATLTHLFTMLTSSRYTCSDSEIGLLYSVSELCIPKLKLLCFKYGSCQNTEVNQPRLDMTVNKLLHQKLWSAKVPATTSVTAFTFKKRSNAHTDSGMQRLTFKSKSKHTFAFFK